MSDWHASMDLAEKMIPIIGQLYRRNIITTLYNYALYNKSPVQLLKMHAELTDIKGNSVNIHQTYPILLAVEQRQDEMKALRIDLATLVRLIERDLVPESKPFSKENVQIEVAKWVANTEMQVARGVEVPRDVVDSLYYYSFLVALTHIHTNTHMHTLFRDPSNQSPYIHYIYIIASLL